MKVCPRCGYNNPDNAELCLACRYPLIGITPSTPVFPPPTTQPFRLELPQQQNLKVCPRCGYVNPGHANFCANCGYQLQYVPPLISPQVQQKKEVKFPYIKFLLSIIIAYLMIFIILSFL